MQADKVSSLTSGSLTFFKIAQTVPLKAKSCTIIFLVTISTIIFLNHINESVVFALDIKEMVAKKPEFEVGTEKVELSSYFFF